MTAPAQPRLEDYLQHIVQAIDRIERYTAAMDLAGFAVDSKTQDAVVRNIEVVGEAARNIQRQHADFAALHGHVPWAVMVGMRNRVSHGYFALDWNLIWATVRNDLPPLRVQVRALSGIGSEPNG
jgi:uncharacterized protein with HEPN domain